MDKASEHKMGKAPIVPLLFSMGVPIMISMMVQALYNVVDSIFISRPGEAALTAVSLIFPIQIIIIAFAVGTAVGMNALLSRRLGEGRAEQASDVAMHGITLALVLGGIMALFGLTLPLWFIPMFTRDAAIVSMGNTYVLIITIFSFSVFGQLMVERIMQGSGDTITPMFTQILGAVINIVLDPILIFGYLGFPALGVKGAAIATVTAQLIAFTLGFILLKKRSKIITIAFRKFTFKWRTVKDIYQVGFSSIIMQSIGSLMSVGMNAILITFSSTAVAFFGVYFRLQSFIFMPIFGLVTAMISIVAFNYGARQKERILATIRVTAFIAIGIMSAGTLLFFFAAEQLLGLFDASAELLEIGIPAMKIISFHFPIAATAITLSVSFQGLGKGMYSLVMSIIRQLGVLLPAAYILSSIWGVHATWYAFIFSELASITMGILFFRRVYTQRIQPLSEAPAVSRAR